MTSCLGWILRIDPPYKLHGHFWGGFPINFLKFQALTHFGWQSGMAYPTAKLPRQSTVVPGYIMAILVIVAQDIFSQWKVHDSTSNFQLV